MEHVLGRYALGTLFAHGGLGDLYHGQDLATGKAVAVKRIRPSVWADRGVREKIEQGVQTVVHLRHPNLLRVFGAGMYGGTYCVVMEFVEGRSLDGFLGQERRLPPGVAAHVASEVCGGLGYAFSNGMVAHRDIKPSNIMVSAEGRVVLTDFDTARPERSQLDRSIVLMTKRYVAPEVLCGARGNEQSDIFSLGVVLYESVAGAYPFPDRAASVADLVGTGEQLPFSSPWPLSEFCAGIDASFQAVVEKALASDPRNRYPRVSDFQEALGPFVSGDAARRVSLLGSDTESTEAPRPSTEVGGHDLLRSFDDHPYFLSPAPDEGAAYVLLPEAVGAPHTLALQNGMTFGRSASCDVTLEDGSVSRRHAQIRVSAGAWQVEDLNSRNGIRVNGALVGKPHVLADEDVIEVGRVAMMFVAPRRRSTEGAEREDTVVPISVGDELTDVCTLKSLKSEGAHSTVYVAEGGKGESYLVYFLDERLAHRPEAVERFRYLFSTRAAGGASTLSAVRALGVWRDRPYAVVAESEGAALSEVIEASAGGVRSRIRLGVSVARIFADLSELGATWGTLCIDDFRLDASGRSVVLCEREYADPGDYASLSPKQVGSVSREYLVDAPEGHHCDLYSLGAILHEILTGECPYPGENVYEVESRKLKGLLRRVDDIAPSVPRHIADAVRGLMGGNVEARPAAAEVAALLERGLESFLPDPGVPEADAVSVLRVLLEAISTGPVEDRAAAVRALLPGPARAGGLEGELESGVDPQVSLWAGRLAESLQAGRLPDLCGGEVDGASRLVRALTITASVWAGRWDVESLWSRLASSAGFERACALWGIVQAGEVQKLELVVARYGGADAGLISPEEVRVLVDAGYCLLDGSVDFAACPAAAREALVGSIPLHRDARSQEEHYREALGDPEEAVRAAAFRAMGAHPSRRWLPLLLRGLEDGSPAVRACAIQALADVGQALRKVKEGSCSGGGAPGIPYGEEKDSLELA